MKYFVVYIILLFSLSCNKNSLDIDSVCDVTNPLTDIDWLSEKVKVWDKESTSPDFTLITISKSLMEEKSSGTKLYGFLFKVNGGSNNYTTDYFNCEGNLICHSTSGAGSPHTECTKYKILESVIIYKH